MAGAREHGPLRSRRCSRTSHTASNASLCAADTTSFGNGAAASSANGISASHGARSTIIARTDSSTSGGSGEGALKSAPTRSTNARRKSSGGRSVGHSGASSPTSSATAGCSGATPKAGGSGHRERSQVGRPCREERHDPAVGVADEMVSRLEHLQQLSSLDVEVDPLERRVRRIAGPSRHDERVALGKRTLRGPARVAAGSVDEHKPRAGPHDLDVHSAPS